MSCPPSNPSVHTPLPFAPDAFRNSSKGTIYAPHLRNSQIEDILAYLQSKRVPVTQVYRFPPRRNTEETLNPRLLLTFSTPFPSTAIRLGFTRCSVRTYVPSPRRCYRCQAFGHPPKYYRAPSPRCPNCGSTSHDSCSDPPSCPNCLGPHPSSHPICPAFLHEKTIQHLVTAHKISRREASLRSQATQPPKTSYANVAAHPPPRPLSSHVPPPPLHPPVLPPHVLPLPPN